MLAVGSFDLLSSSCTKLDNIELVSMLFDLDKLLCSSLIGSKHAFGRELILCVDTQDDTRDPDRIAFPNLKCMCTTPLLVDFER